MPSPFSRTFRSVEADSEERSRAVLFGAALILGVWAIWFSLARLSVYVASDSAQLEVMRATHPVDAPVAGRVVEMNVALDQEVHGGDVLVVLDSESQRLQLAEANARAQGIAPQLEATRETLEAEDRALGDLSQQSHSAIDVGKAKVKEAQAAAKLARSEAERLEGLHTRGSVSEMEAIRARAAADQKDAQLSGLQADLMRLQHEYHTNRDDRRTRVSGLEREVSKLDADLAAIKANIDTIQHDIERRSIRASADGKLGEIGTVRLGSVVRGGSYCHDRLAGEASRRGPAPSGLRARSRQRGAARPRASRGVPLDGVRRRYGARLRRRERGARQPRACRAGHFAALGDGPASTRDACDRRDRGGEGISVAIDSPRRGADGRAHTERAGTVSPRASLRNEVSMAAFLERSQPVVGQ